MTLGLILILLFQKNISPQGIYFYKDNNNKGCWTDDTSVPKLLLFFYICSRTLLKERK